MEAGLRIVVNCERDDGVEIFWVVIPRFVQNENR
jgi:hypothetical protein